MCGHRHWTKLPLVYNSGPTEGGQHHRWATSAFCTEDAVRRRRSQRKRLNRKPPTSILCRCNRYVRQRSIVITCRSCPHGCFRVPTSPVKSHLRKGGSSTREDAQGGPPQSTTSNLTRVVDLNYWSTSPASHENHIGPRCVARPRQRLVVPFPPSTLLTRHG